MTTTDRLAKAETDFQTAKSIVVEDRAAADRYALASLDGYIAINGRLHRNINTEAKRARYLELVAVNAQQCAAKIVADGRAHYEDEHGLIVCTLAADASAGAFGYDRW